MAQLTNTPADGVRVRVTRGSKNPLWFGLGARLRFARTQAGLAAMTVGDLAGVSLNSSTLIEREQSIPGIDMVEKIAFALGVPPCWLAYGADGEEPFQQKIPRLLDPPRSPSPQPTQAVAPLSCRELGLRLRLAREARGLSMRQLAAAAGLSAQAVSLLEADRMCPSVETCERLAVALDVAPCWLAYGVGRGPVLN